MKEESAVAERKGGGFVWGLLVGGAGGFLLARYLSTEAGREHLDTLRSRTVELTGDPEQLRQRAAAAASTVRGAVSDAIQEGMYAARQRREEVTARAVRLAEAADTGRNERVDA
jgi:hypothetical protein